MEVYRNLVSDSPLVEETIEMLRRCGGRTCAARVAGSVLKLPDLEPPIAALIISELIKDDWRLRLTEACEIELASEGTERAALDEMDFVVVDVETTGAKMSTCRITEIGAYRISQGRIVGEFQTLVNPESAIPSFISRLTGITDQMVKSAPCFAEVAPAWLRFAGTSVLVAHNARFDTRFLDCEIGRVFPGRRMSNSQLCTVTLARRLLPDLINHRLHTVADHFQITITNRHRAAGDALATAEIFLRLLHLLDRRGVRDMAAARRLR